MEHKIKISEAQLGPSLGTVGAHQTNSNDL